MQVTLGEICSFTNGGTPKKSVPEYWTGGIPFITGADIDEENGTITEPRGYITEEAISKSSTNLISTESILLVTRTGVGKVAIPPYPVCVSQDFTALSFDPKVVHQRYLFHVLRSAKDSFVRQARGATIQGITREVVSSFKFNLPNYPEQERIATILDKADEIKIASNETEKLRANLIRSTFLELFSEVEPNWPIVQLSDVADITCEFVTPTSLEFNELPHIGPDRIKGYTGEILPYKSAREDNVTSGKFHFSNNEILYSKIRPYLRKCAAPDFEGLCSADIYPLTPKEGIVKEYLWYLLLSDEFDRYTQTLPDRSSIPKLNRTELWRFSFPLPPITLQKQFADVVNSVKNLVDVRDLAQENALSLVQELLA